MNQRNLNASAGVLGITALGIFAVWFPTAVLSVPMPTGLIASTATMTFWETFTGVFIPYLWAVKRLGMSVGDLGLTHHKLGMSTLLGCGIYAIALAAFLHCAGGEMMANHTIRKVSLGEAFVLVPLMGVTAAATDMATRGFILLTLARHSHVVFAIAMQNLVWFLGHIYEIGLLTDCLGVTMAVGLTLTLGILGDVVVLRTRNVMGLAAAHILLNVALSIYLRYL
jgi:membrane protease YdiL (CAAX protease family)